MGQVVRVGLIGCGMVAQVIHIPTLGHLSDKFQITYLCDVSLEALKHCQKKIIGGVLPQITQDPIILVSSAEVDIVFCLASDEYHADHAVLALNHGKHVFIEKPVALNIHDLDSIIAAKNGAKRKAMVGYMRRYSLALEEAIKLIGGIDKIVYARVRNIKGRNTDFVGQSGGFPQAFGDVSDADKKDRSNRARSQSAQALGKEMGINTNAENTALWGLLNGLGSHDLSAMREVLGMPQKVLGSSLRPPFWHVLFDFGSFSLTY